MYRTDKIPEKSKKLSRCRHLFVGISFPRPMSFKPYPIQLGLVVISFIFARKRRMKMVGSYIVILRKVCDVNELFDNVFMMTNGFVAQHDCLCFLKL